MTPTLPEAKAIIGNIQCASGGSQHNTHHARLAKRAVKRMARRLQEAEERVRALEAQVAITAGALAFHEHDNGG